MFISYLYVFFVEISVYVFWPLFYWVVCVSGIELHAAAAKSLQSCDSVRPHRWQPTRLPRPWDSPGKNTELGCHFVLQCVKVKLLSHVQLIATPWTSAYQAPPSKGFSRQE